MGCQVAVAEPFEPEAVCDAAAILEGGHAVRGAVAVRNDPPQRPREGDELRARPHRVEAGESIRGQSRGDSGRPILL